MRELLIDKGLNITDFNGQQIEAKAFSDRYGVRLTPTLLFLDAKGHELTQRIVGVSTIEYFSFYLETAIDQAREKLKSDTH